MKGVELLAKCIGMEFEQEQTEEELHARGAKIAKEREDISRRVAEALRKLGSMIFKSGKRIRRARVSQAELPHHALIAKAGKKQTCAAFALMQRFPQKISTYPVTGSHSHPDCGKRAFEHPYNHNFPRVPGAVICVGMAMDE